MNDPRGIVTDVSAFSRYEHNNFHLLDAKMNDWPSPLGTPSRVSPNENFSEQKSKSPGQNSNSPCASPDNEAKNLIQEKIMETTSNNLETSKVWKTKNRFRLITFDELPDWAKDNEFIKGSYRPILPSFVACFATVFRIHNETVNVWSHLLGFLAFMYASFHFLSKPNDQYLHPVYEKAILMTFFFGACVCLGFSWSFHALGCHSAHVSCMFAKLDYSGIAIMIMGSFVPWLYYMFYCDTVFRFCYIFFICTLGTLCVLMSQSDTFATPKYRPLRAGVFAGLGLCAVIPITHGCIEYGFAVTFYDGKLWCLFTMGALYLIGALIYATRVPECWSPGTFDIWLSSHQIFHILIVLAAAVHLYAIANLQMQRKTMGEPCFY